VQRYINILQTGQGHIHFEFMVGFVVFNATFNTILVIWWPPVLLMEESGVPGENHRPVASH